MLHADGKPSVGRACGSFGLSRGSLIDPFEPQNGHSGELPWITLWKSAKDTPKYRNLAESQFVQGMKMKTKPEALTQGLPDIFCQFMKDVKKLGYDEKPNYEVRVL